MGVINNLPKGVYYFPYDPTYNKILERRYFITCTD